MIPELQERGILRNIIHNLYVALKKRNDNVVRYKALIDAKVPKKGNSYRKEMLTSISFSQGYRCESNGVNVQ